MPTDAQEIELFANHDQSQLFVTIWARPHSGKREKSYQDFFGNLQRELPQLVGARVLATDNVEGSFAETSNPMGAAERELPRCRARIYGERGVILQVNRTLLDNFVAAVMGEESGDLAWDLYAGVGLFSVALAERFQRVIAVESSAAACKDLRHNLRNTRAEYSQTPTLNFLRRAVAERQPAPDLILLDPPRAGAGAEATTMLADLNPNRIVYVSCDPATLGRDLAALIQSGYRLLRLLMVDMFRKRITWKPSRRFSAEFAGDIMVPGTTLPETTRSVRRLHGYQPAPLRATRHRLRKEPLSFGHTPMLLAAGGFRSGSSMRDGSGILRYCASSPHFWP